MTLDGQVKPVTNGNASLNGGAPWLTISLFWSVTAVPERQGGIDTQAVQQILHEPPYISNLGDVRLPDIGPREVRDSNLCRVFTRVNGASSVREPLIRSGIAESYVLPDSRVSPAGRRLVTDKRHSRVRQISPQIACPRRAG